MNEEMESELTKMDSRPDNLEVYEDASVDEAVPINLRKVRSTESKKWRPTYEAIDEAYIKDFIISLLILLIM